MSECRKVQPVVDAFVDGELSTERVFETEEHSMLSGVMRLADRSARGLMTPRLDVVAIDDQPDGTPRITVIRSAFECS